MTIPLEATTPPSGSVAPGYNPYKCHSLAASQTTGIDIEGNNKSYVLNAEGNDTRIVIRGNSHKVCVLGDLTLLTIYGNGSHAYISGNIGALNMHGNSTSVTVYGSVATARISGNSNNLKANSIATYDSTGNSNNISSISK